MLFFLKETSTQMCFILHIKTCLKYNKLLFGVYFQMITFSQNENACVVNFVVFRKNAIFYYWKQYLFIPALLQWVKRNVYSNFKIWYSLHDLCMFSVHANKYICTCTEMFTRKCKNRTFNLIEKKYENSISN